MFTFERLNISQIERKCSNTLLLSDNKRYSCVFHTCIKCVRLFVKCISGFYEREGLIAPTSYIVHTSFNKDIFQFNRVPYLPPIPRFHTYTHVPFRYSFQTYFGTIGVVGEAKVL